MEPSGLSPTLARIASALGISRQAACERFSGQN
jgi:hypothetical protein